VFLDLISSAELLSQRALPPTIVLLLLLLL
jgi:hypothetical protein